MFEQSETEDPKAPDSVKAKPVLTSNAEAMMDDVLMSMRGILATHEVDKCAACFQRLSAAMDKIDSYPGNAEHYLREWAEKTRLLKHQNGCDHCHPPVFGDTGRNSGHHPARP